MLCLNVLSLPFSVLDDGILTRIWPLLSQPQPTEEAIRAAKHPVSSGAAEPSATYDNQGRLVAPPGMAAPGADEVEALPSDAPGSKAGQNADTGDQPKSAALATTVAAGRKPENRFLATAFRARDHISHSHLGSYLSQGVLIFGASFFVWLFTLIRLGALGMIITGLFVVAAYGRAIERVQVRYKDDQERIMVRTQALDRVPEGDGEKMMWLNNFLARFWPIYMPALSAQVIQIADGILVQNCPSFLDAIRLTQFTLGSKAPKINHVRTFPHTDPDTILTEWKFEYTPEDTSDMTVKQAKNKIDPKVELSVRIGAGLAGATFPILVQNMQFSGTLRVQFKLIPTFPNVQTVGISFMEPPMFSYVLKPVGGNKLGIDVGNIPGLHEFIQGQVHANLGPMMYSPNVFTVNLEELLAGNLMDTATGVLQVSLYGAKEVQGAKLGGGTPDPYVSLALNEQPDPVGRTTVVRSSAQPRWGETKFVLVNSLAGFLTLNLMDENGVRADSALGTATFDLSELASNPDQDGRSDPIILSGKPRGTLQYGLAYFPLLKPEMSPEGTPLPLPETRTGVLILHVQAGKNLGDKQLNARARVYLNGASSGETNVFKKSDAPNWGFTLPLLVTQRERAVVGIEVLNDDKDRPVGALAVKLDDLLEASSRGQEWFPLPLPGQGASRARVNLKADWKPVHMTGSVNSGAGYTPPLGALRITLGQARLSQQHGHGNKQTTLPFVELRNKGQVTDRSAVLYPPTPEPHWNGEALYAPIHALRERIMLEVMDYQPNGKHRYLGTTSFDTKSFAAEMPKKTLPDGSELEALNDPLEAWPVRSLGRKNIQAKLKLGKNEGGTVDCMVEFVPAVHLRDAFFHLGDEPEAVKRAKGAGDQTETEADAGAGAGTSELEGQDRDAPTSATTDQTEGPLQSSTQSTGLTGAAEVATAAGKSITETGAQPETQAEDSEEKEEKQGGVLLTSEQLLAQPQGVLALNILEAKLSVKQARVEILVDDGYWPSYQTAISRGAVHTFDEVSQSVVKDLSNSMVTVRVRTRGSEGEGNDTNLSDVVAETVISAQQLLELSLGKKTELALTPNPSFNPQTIPGFGNLSEGAQESARNAARNATRAVPGLNSGLGAVSSGISGISGGLGLNKITSGAASAVGGAAKGVTGAVGSVAGAAGGLIPPGVSIPVPLGAAGGPCELTVSSRWIPLPFVPSVKETVLNQGYLTIEAVRAEGLRGADRGGKSSDPFAALVNAASGERITQTKTIKKTLKPTWNEVLAPESENHVPVRDRSRPGWRIEVRDWDQLGKGDALGGVDIPDLWSLSAPDTASSAEGQVPSGEEAGGLKPNEPYEVTLPLTGQGAGDNNPRITLRLTFSPQWVPQGRAGINVAAHGLAANLGGGVNAVGGAMGGVVGGVGQGVGAVGGAVGGVGKHVISGPRGLFGRKKGSGEAEEADASTLSSPPGAGGEADAADESMATLGSAAGGDDTRSLFGRKGKKLGLFRKHHD